MKSQFAASGLKADSLAIINITARNALDRKIRMKFDSTNRAAWLRSDSIYVARKASVAKKDTTSLKGKH